MFGLPLAFAAPAVLVALVGLGALYFLLRVTPPRPRQALFPPLRLLIGLDPKDTEPARTPWPILALRLAVGALIILAMAEPLWNSLAGLAGSGPLLVADRRRMGGGADLRKADRLCPAADGSRRPRRPDRRDQAAVAGRPKTSPRSTLAEIEGRLRSLGARALRPGPRGRAAGDRAVPDARAEGGHPLDRRRRRTRRRERISPRGSRR